MISLFLDAVWMVRIKVLLSLHCPEMLAHLPVKPEYKNILRISKVHGWL